MVEKMQRTAALLVLIHQAEYLRFGVIYLPG